MKITIDYDGRERLMRFGEIWVVDETDCFRPDFIDKMEIGFRITAPYLGAVLQRR